VKYLSLVLPAILLLSGCQTGTYMSSAATDGNGITCNEIYQAFNAYERDRQSAQALRQLSQMVSQDAGTIAGQGIEKAEQYYPQAKASANLALTIRGCQPLQ
jgi:S-ribosylhomocysteine lyase LuxS involved in autoinducer biosynthesis